MNSAAARTWTAIVADTDTGSLANIRKWMHGLGYDTERVRSADAIVSALSGRTRAVVIASLSLPGLDAARLCRDVRAAVRNAYVLFFLDGDAEQAMMEQAVDAGADDVVSKPLVEAELRARLHLAGGFMPKAARIKREGE